MKYARLGNSGLMVSSLALGTMTFGEGGGVFANVAKVDQATADLLVGQALDAGINYFNTADIYADGQSEEMLGKALGVLRQNALIATKGGNRLGPGVLDRGLSRRHLIAAAEASLRRLGTDWIDVYLLHATDPHTPIEETLEAIQHLVTQGKVRYVGYSNFPAWLSAKALGIQGARGWEPFRAAELYYSLIGRDIEHEIIPFAADSGIGIQVWSPLAGGFLAGRYTRDDPSGANGRLADFNVIPFDRASGYDIVEKLRAIALRYDATPAQLALRWLMSRPNVSSIIVGASRPEQLAENLAAVELEIDDADLSEMDRFSPPAEIYPGWFMKMISDSEMKETLSH